MCPRNCASSNALRGGKCCSGMEAQCTAFAPADTADSGNSGEQYPGAGELPANLGPVAGTKPTSNGPLRSGAQENACQFTVLQRNRVSALQHFHQTSNYVTLVTKPTLPSVAHATTKTMQQTGVLLITPHPSITQNIVLTLDNIFHGTKRTKYIPRAVPSLYYNTVVSAGPGRWHVPRPKSGCCGPRKE